MATQLTLDFNVPIRRMEMAKDKNKNWIDVTIIAQGAGFTDQIYVSIDLNDALKSGQTEIDDEFDQRLYDVLWLSNLQMSLNQSMPTTFNFHFNRTFQSSQEPREERLRLHVKRKSNMVFLGLLDDFQWR